MKKTRAAIHIIKKALGLDEDAYRDALAMQFDGREEVHKALLLEAIDELVVLQKASQPGQLPPYDHAVMLREVNLFPEWFAAKELGKPFTAEQNALWQQTVDTLLPPLLAQPTVYVHRDFIVRNLMLTSGRPGVLDFQDALYGPIAYDLVSLLRDAFIGWEEEFVLDLVIRYWEKARAAGLPVPEAFDDFYRGFEWMGVEAFRVRSLQVCPDCLKERERCPAVWELTGYCVCVRHHRLLIDRCGRCQRQLGWSRPATDICRCKHYLARTAEQAVANPLLTAWCAWLESRSVGARLLDVAGVLPTWLLPLEPDAAFQLMMALGRRRAEGERFSAADGVRAVTPTDMAACVARGLALAPALSDNSALQREAAELIDAARLERLVRFGVDETVRRIARQLLGRMRRPSRLNQIGQPMRNGRATRGQLELFGDDEK